MSMIPAIYVQIKDAVGQPVPGGKLHTYVTGTTTNKTAYTDAAKTVPHTNPIIANAAGICGPIFLTDAEAYTFTEKDASDGALRSVDGIFSGMLTSESLVTRVKQIASNPVDYGAVGDGAADERDEVQSAIDGVSGSGVVDLLGLTFLCDTRINMADGVTLRNGILKFTNCLDNECIQVNGDIGAYSNLTVDGAVNASSVTVDDTTDLAAGQVCNVRDDTGYYVAGQTLKGEMVVIESIADLQVNLQGPLHDLYETGQSAQFARMIPMADVTLQGLTISAKEAVAGTTNVIGAKAARRLRIRDVDIDAIDGAGVYVSDCYDTLIESCTISDGLSGVQIVGASALTKIKDTTFTGLDLGVIVNGTESPTYTTGGVPQHVTISDCRFQVGGSSASPQISVDADSRYVDILRNTFDMTATDAGGAISIGSVDCRIDDNEVYRDGTGTPTAISLANQCPSRAYAHNFSVKVRRNTVRTDGLGIEANHSDVTGGAGTIAIVEISGNDVVAASDDITVDCGASAISADIATLVLDGNTTNGPIEVRSDHASATIDKVVTRNNTFESFKVTGTTQSIGNLTMSSDTVSGTDAVKCVDIASIDDARITNLEIYGDGVDNDVGVEITDTLTVSITGGMIQGVTTTGIDIDEAQYMDIVGVRINSADRAILINNDDSTEFQRCKIVGCTLTASANSAIEISALDADRSKNLCITGNYIESSGGAGEYPIEVSGLIDGGTITGNTCTRSNDTDSNIYVAGSAVGGVTKFSITGNALTNGTYGIEVSNNTTTKESQNSFSSMATGNVRGQFMMEGGLHRIVASVLYTDFTDGGGAVGTLTLNDTIPDGSLFIRSMLTDLIGFSGDVSATVTIGDGADVDRYNTGTPSVFTTEASGVDVGAPSGTAWHGDAKTPVITITTNADWTSVSAGACTVELLFYHG